MIGQHLAECMGWVEVGGKGSKHDEIIGILFWSLCRLQQKKDLLYQIFIFTHENIELLKKVS